MEKDLEALRGQIDEIDNKLVELFRERMEVCAQVAEYKKAHGLPVLAAGRERALLGKVTAQAGEELADYTQSLYRTILSASRSYQNAKLEGSSAIYDSIRKTLSETHQLFPQRPTVACQGIEGSDAQAACLRLFKTPTVLFFQTYDHVFQAVERGMCQYGILPIEDSAAGSVKAVYDLMLRHNFSIVRSVRRRVDSCLLAPHGVQERDVREIFASKGTVHQCAAYLSGRKDAALTIVESAAAAARMAAQSGRTDTAALATRFCAEEYGLDILQEKVQDQDSNYTRFICISKKPEIYPGADRTSLMLTLPHRPGSLYNVLAKFYALNIDLQKLESRPLPGREFEFMFYFDLEAPVYAPEMEKLFRDLEADCEELRYLGTYQEVVC
ncbi:MAG: bifunctional chorismate mutase/prephenate dehydratase [Lawsonibacter sp.]|nr:bifunctional chorismate mutase/prephenate dehydratase [Lawsonibacter sp.]